ncbi:hypothetical protein B0H34DRAFT_724970 [Crassisporium funariophilum]|nr:hypothetical protein B0H34DRAFT_724970 [Crassisporium funariophilum]
MCKYAMLMIIPLLSMTSFSNTKTNPNSSLQLTSFSVSYDLPYTQLSNTTAVEQTPYSYACLSTPLCLTSLYFIFVVPYPAY